MKLICSTFAVVVACLCVAPAAASTPNGAASITIVPSHCRLATSGATVHRELLGTGASIDTETTEVSTAIRLLGVPAGRYLMKIDSGTCSGQFFLSIFPKLTRNVVALVRRLVPGGEHDIYTVPYDAVAIRLPFAHMNVNASMTTGEYLSTQIDGNLVFVDNIPSGEFVLRASGANFVLSATYTSHAANNVSVHSLDLSNLSVGR